MLFQDIINWLMALSVQYGYFGVFLISLLGAASIFFPVPDTSVVFALGGSLLFEPALIAVAAAVGAAVGEFTGYLLGLGGRKPITKRYGKMIDFLRRLFDRWGSWAIFAFSATPLPDDLVFIPLGIMRYNVAKAFIPAFAGKLCFNLVVAYGGRFFVGAIGEFFGVTNDWIPALVSMVLGVVLFIVMLRVDWSKYFDKYLASKDRQENRNEGNSQISSEI